METQLLEVQENLVEVPDQFQKCKKQKENLTNKKLLQNRTTKLENNLLKNIFKELEQVIKYREI